MSEQEPVLELMDVGLTYWRRHSLFRHTEFKALQGINLALHRGETLGVIGKNGSGKSTLLRILAGIYKPDTGRIVKHCRSVSLLSLGMGFDAELSGIDNAIILGMLLGSRKSEVKAQLDDIIEFSELGEFIREPIKTYSSGMRARLGFSVAVKMRADVLLLDEVLSVGDKTFRRKAEKAMRDLIDSDQTVVFVSHAMDAVEEMCNRVLWLESGKIKRLGETSEVLEEYDGW